MALDIDIDHVPPAGIRALTLRVANNIDARNAAVAAADKLFFPQG